VSRYSLASPPWMAAFQAVAASHSRAAALHNKVAAAAFMNDEAAGNK